MPHMERQTNKQTNRDQPKSKRTIARDWEGYESRSQVKEGQTDLINACRVHVWKYHSDSHEFMQLIC